MKKVLFICVQNSARSQMAEGLGRHFQGKHFEFASAGSQPGSQVHPMALTVMAEIGIDISSHRPKAMEEVDMDSVSRIIALCAEENCPVIPANVELESWAMPEPANKDESEDKQLARFRKIRDAIREKVRVMG